MVEEYDDTCEISYEVDIKTLFVYHATQSDMDAYEWPNDVKEIIIYGDEIYNLCVPDGVETVTCGHIPLKSLYLPDSVTRVYCDNCCLKNLDLPAGIKKVMANQNWLKRVTFRGQPYQLEELHLRENRLISIDFVPPESLHNVDFGLNRHRPIKMPPALARHINNIEDCEL